jgi:transcriptional regulator of heat shock response
MKEAIYRERKDRILGIVVNSYIKTVTPVSSSYIVDEHQLDLSPATIRNILAELEEDGFFDASAYIGWSFADTRRLSVLCR